MTFEEAEMVVAAAKARSAELGLAHVSVAVVDARADLVVLARLTGARYWTVDIARGKAMTAAVFQAPSGTLVDSEASALSRCANGIHGGGLIFLRGGVPIVRGEQCLGAVGVSGASGEEDEEIAIAAAAAL